MANGAALANDSSATLGAGGLVFVQQPHVEMQAEDLYLSPEKVRVRYVFRNIGKEDVTTLVAFPMPPVGAVDDFNTVILPSHDPVNFMEMTVKVDGKPVATEVEQKAMALGLDRTALLRELGIPVAPYVKEAREAIAALPADKRAELTAMGLTGRAFGGTQPGWTLHTTYYWMQTFPAGREVTVEHGYRPVIGTTLAPPVGLTSNEPETVASARKRYCITDAMMAGIDARATGSDGGPGYTFFGAELKYILRTAANWSGPIRHFQITVEASKPEDFAFLCLDGARRVSPARLEMTADNFRPWTDLTVFFLRTIKLED